MIYRMILLNNTTPTMKDEYREEITKMKERLKSLQKKYKDFNPEE